MALKGFLASGFQKLIGASRIKGANEKYLGEFNLQTFSTTSFPLAASIHDGFNFVKYTGNAALVYPGGALFTPTPTSEAVVILYNASPGGYSITLDTDIATGGLVVSGGKIVLRPGDSIMMIYDTALVRWREISRTPWGVEAKSLTVSSGTGLSLLSNSKDLFVTLRRSGSTDLVLTAISGFYTIPTSIGNRLTIQGAYDLDMTYSVTFQQFTGVVGLSTFTSLLLNGDFVLTRNSTLTLIQTEAGWVEISRSTPTY